MGRLASHYGLMISVLLLLAAIGLPGCTAPATVAPPSPELTPSPDARPPIEAQLRESFRATDPAARRAAVLLATESFLRDPALRGADDSIASSYYTTVAFSSGQLTLPDPAVIQRQGDLAVVALPEGLGLFLYDLGTLGAEPVELSRWLVSLSGMHVTWGEGELGVAYATLGRDGVTRTHFALATADDLGWRLSWLSDEAPDWWFNAYDGTLTVAPDLSYLELTGEAASTTEAFYELDSEPRRVFRVRWVRAANTYQVSPPPAGYPTRQAWLWNVARPSPYATLVEFIERLQMGDENGAARLASEASITAAALDSGLHLPERRFQVIEEGQDRIIFRDLQGVYVAEFEPPAPGGGPWLITGLAPFGAPTPEPQDDEP